MPESSSPRKTRLIKQGLILGLVLIVAAALAERYIGANWLRIPMMLTVMLVFAGTLIATALAITRR